MANLKVKNLNRIKLSIRKDIIKTLRSESVRTGIGEIVVSEIQKERVVVKSKATKIWRRYLEQKNMTSKKYDINFINITFTGALLKDLANNVRAKFSRRNAIFVIEPSNKKHRKYRKPNGKLVKGTAKTFKQVSDFVIAKGYEYLDFSDTSKNRVLKFIKKEIIFKLGK